MAPDEGAQVRRRGIDLGVDGGGEAVVVRVKVLTRQRARAVERVAESRRTSLVKGHVG